MTPSQTCPWPNDLGRNLRSKTRWFTGFCNSHQVSHFATFFIDARAEISVAESRYGYKFCVAHCRCTVSGTARERHVVVFLGAFNAGGSFLCREKQRDWLAPRCIPAQEAHDDERRVPPSSLTKEQVHRSCCLCKVSTMILPQVHLRKPCYDFSFL